MSASIALCTYNGEKFIADQLESYVSQTVLPEELVVCDDRSTDETIRIIERFAADAPFRVSIHVNETTLGSTKNFQKAMTLCSGAYIFLSDQDDVWQPRKIEKITEILENEPETEMVFSDADLVGEELRPLNVRLWDRTFPRRLRRSIARGTFIDIQLSQNVVTGATMAFRANCRYKFIPIPADIPNLIHDAWIATVLAVDGSVTMTDEPLIKYRQHSGQQLGLRLGTGTKPHYDERRVEFDHEIAYLENEKLRLEALGAIFATDPRFVGKSLTEKAADLLREKGEMISHYKRRGGLPRSRPLRILPVVRELAGGRYHRFSRGVLSAAKDVLSAW